MLLYVWARQQPTCAPHLPVHERGGVAAVADAAVEVLLPAAHPADAAVRAVVLPLAQVVLKEVAPVGRVASLTEVIGTAYWDLAASGAELESACLSSVRRTTDSCARHVRQLRCAAPRHSHIAFSHTRQLYCLLLTQDSCTARTRPRMSCRQLRPVVGCCTGHRPPRARPCGPVRDA